VATTSSRSTTAFPFTIFPRPGSSWKALATFRLRCSAVKPTWLAVRRARRSTRQSGRNAAQQGNPDRQQRGLGCIVATTAASARRGHDQIRLYQEFGAGAHERNEQRAPARALPAGRGI